MLAILAMAIETQNVRLLMWKYFVQELQKLKLDS